MDQDEDKRFGSDYAYMEELKKAYEAALAKRLVRPSALSEEKRELLIRMQREILGAAERAYPAARSEEGKELLLMLRESADESLRLLESRETTSIMGNIPDASLLSHALILANRSYNLLIRHSREISPLATLILSELSALYALAAIG